MVLPLLKLGTLLLRQLSKPLANVVKSRAKRHENFRLFISNYAQRYHQWSTNFQRRLYGYDTEVDVRPLNEERAVQAAADLVGETVIFSVAGAVLMFEYGRSARSDARKEEARRQEIDSLADRIEMLETFPAVREWKERMEKAAKESEVQAKQGLTTQTATAATPATTKPTIQQGALASLQFWKSA